MDLDNYADTPQKRSATVKTMKSSGFDGVQMVFVDVWMDTGQHAGLRVRFSSGGGGGDGDGETFLMGSRD